MVTGFSGTPRSVVAKTIDVGNVTAATCLEVTTTGIDGAMPNMLFVVGCDALEANLNIGNARGTAVGTVKWRITNPTAGDINPASHEYWFIGL